MKTPRIVRSATLRGRRGIVLFVSGALAIGHRRRRCPCPGERLASSTAARRGRSVPATQTHRHLPGDHEPQPFGGSDPAVTIG